VDAQLSIAVGSGDATRVRIVNPVGAPFVVESSEAQAWKTEFTATPSDHGLIRLSGRILQNGAVMSSPTLIVKPGEPASIEIAASGAASSMRIEATLALHDAAWTIAAENAGTVDAAGSTTVVAPPPPPPPPPPLPPVPAANTASEQTSYRDTLPPPYPEDAVQSHQSGHLELRVLVDEAGAPQTVDVFKAEPPEAAAAFSASAIATVKQWRFNPARSDGKPVSGYVLVPIDYRSDG
jgi:TonB family protein